MIKRIEVIQLLRGCAALIVCFFHMKGILNTTPFNFGTTYLGGGAIGVSLFFIISGFIMVYTTHESDGSILYVNKFMIKRLIRIIPLYYIMVLFWVFAYDTHLDFFSKDIMTLVKTFCFIPIFDSPVGPSYGMPPLKVGWALNYEIFFYLIFGLSLFMKKYRWITLFFVFTVLLILVPVFLKGFISFEPSYNYHFRFLYLLLITNPMMVYFILGIALGLLYNSSFSIRSRWIQTSLLSFSIGLFLLIYFRVPPFINNFLLYLFSCSLLFFGLLYFNKQKGIKVPALFSYLGDMSYSLFLIHPTVIIVLPMLLRFLNYPGNFKGTIYFFILITCIIGLSILSYELLEKRLLRSLAKVLTSSGVKKETDKSPKREHLISV